MGCTLSIVAQGISGVILSFREDMTLTFTLFQIIMTVTHCKTVLVCSGSLLPIEYECSSQMRPAKRIEAMTEPTMEQNVL